MKKTVFLLPLILLFSLFPACKKAEVPEGGVMIAGIVINPQSVRENAGALISVSLLNRSGETVFVDASADIGAVNPSRAVTSGNAVNIGYTAPALAQGVTQETARVDVSVIDTTGSLLDASQIQVLVQDGSGSSSGSNVRIGSVEVSPQVIDENQSSTITLRLVNPGNQTAVIRASADIGGVSPAAVTVTGEDVTLQYTAPELTSADNHQTANIHIVLEDASGNQADSTDLQVIVRDND